MLLSVYMFSLALGGVLLGASILLGGKDGIEANSDTPDVDTEADVHADVHTEVHPGGGVSKDIEVGGSADFLVWSLTSVRFWTFFLAFFGLTGLVFDGFSLVPHEAISAVLAVGMGNAAGFGISYAMRVLSADDTSRVAESEDYVGKSARVLVAPKPGGVGKVRVDIGGNMVDVLATTDEAGVSNQDQVMIIEMEGTTARVAKVMAAEND